ncbi:MAG: molecular chaperone TorD family protein [Deltaproteobacteria bacterium]|nr:molecular chaperone TorD family protein [Deltaproteobacteria bacterium]
MNIATDTRTRDLVAQAAAWRMASLLLERPRPDWRDEIVGLSSEVIDARLLSAAKNADQATEEKYHQLFGPGGTVSPREVSYCGFEDPGHVMAKLEAFYNAFVFKPGREEPIDHISVEAGFVGYLFLKEAYAEMRGDSDAVEITGNVRERFIKDHLGRSARGMLERITELPAYLESALLWLAEQS